MPREEFEPVTVSQSMDIAVSLPSIAKSAGFYIVTRLARRWVALLILLVAVASIAIAVRANVSEMITAVVLAILLVMLFRLWDDLADLAYDREWHVDRALVSANDLRPFRWSVYGGLPVVALLLGAWRATPQLVVYFVLIAAFTVLYRLTPDHGPGRIARIHLVLTKYPVFIYLCSPAPRPAAALTIGAAAYLVLAAYELFSDSTLRHWSVRRWLLPVEVFALLVLTGATLWMRY